MKQKEESSANDNKCELVMLQVRLQRMFSLGESAHPLMVLQVSKAMLPSLCLTFATHVCRINDLRKHNLRQTGKNR